MKSTLTILLGLVLLIGAAILAFPKLQDQPKTLFIPVMKVKDISHKSQVKTQQKTVPEECVTVQFGLNANFGSKSEITE